ncbi:MAG TPA: Asp-tRNA(Asn)/Glu-tRNA(Gln) amidotransferase subunit GatA [Candidatus Omnitrophica bacterium]|nr:Asp-tRNA(Asn)/Glu-tRNA(Gln) amidotransferase subunit GatA [Candidatus Omnitrophota bacterium]
MEILDIPVYRLRDEIKGGRITPLDVARAYVKRIEEIDSKIKAFVYFNPESIFHQVNSLEENKKTPGKLYGIPVAIKDNICVEDEPTTCCSRILKNFRPPYSATVITKLKNEGAILFGKTNMDEFAFGSSCETSCYGPTHNPFDLERVPGGSSGGSAAAVAAKEVPLALGSDTGGSIRQPAALCGVVGVKPTYGRVSRFGLIAFASSLDQIGSIARNVKDAALLLEVISGYDSNDSTSAPYSVPEYSQNLTPTIKGIKVGIPREYFQEGIDFEVKRRVEEVFEILEKNGACVEWMSLPHTEYALSCYYIIAPAEASSNLARYAGVSYGLRVLGKGEGNPMINMYLATRSQGFGAEVKRRIILGTYSLSSGYYEAYYLYAAKVRTLIKEDFITAFKKYDCIITPTSPTTAFKIGERVSDPLQMYLSDIYTIPANLAGIPAISIPVGRDKNGLPIGLQIMCDYFQEQRMLNIACGIEEILK